MKKKIISRLLIALLATSSLVNPLYAATPPRANSTPPAASNQPSAPAPATVPASDPFQSRNNPLPDALGTLQARGVKITALGDIGGLNGYLLESTDGKFQPAYLTPDGKNIVVGPMFRIEAGGTTSNVTGAQIEAMKQRIASSRAQQEDEAKRAAEARQQQLKQEALDAQSRLDNAQQQVAVTLPGFNGSSTSVDANKPPFSTTSSPTLPTSVPAPSVPNPPAQPVQPSMPTSGMVQPDGSNLNPAAEYISPIDKTRFQAVDSIGWFPVGKEGAPIVYMVADPQCPFCHAAWQKLKPLVSQGKLVVRVIIIDGLPGSKPLALNLLMQPNPALAWYQGSGSEDHPVTPLKAPTADEMKTEQYASAQSWLGLNDNFANEMKINQTPFIAYTGKDGKLYSAFGPKDMSAFLSALF